MSQLASNPWRVTGADALPLTITKGMVKIRHLEGSNWNAAGDTIVVNDALGNTIAILVGPSDKQEVRTGNIGYVTGVTIQSITAASDTLTIYFE